MAETPVNLPDEPTEQSAKQALSMLPTWKEWLEQHGFKQGRGEWGLVDYQYYRAWKKIGRGWLINVIPEHHTLVVNVYNTLLRGGQRFFFFNVAERNVPGLVEKLIKEIERPVSDRTKKKRIVAMREETPYEQREQEPDAVPINQLVMNQQQDQLRELRALGLVREAGPLHAPIPDDPNGLTPDQLDKVLQRVRVRCFQPGQRVRVRSPRETGLNGELGTVVDAGEHSCYVAIDSYTNMGDPDPFRFEEHELEPIFNESEQDVDSPEAYLASVDYMQMLPALGYTVHNENWRPAQTYVKAIDIGSNGFIRLDVEPTPTEDNAQAIIVYVEYVYSAPKHYGRIERLQVIVTDALSVMDMLRDIEQLASQSATVGDFAEALAKRGYARHSQSPRIPARRKLRQLFGESFVDEAEAAEPDPDDLERYIRDLQRHADVINAFREQGLRMRRRMSADRPYYEMFWTPNAVVTYDLFIQPEDKGWVVTAKGDKRSPWGEIHEPFDIEDQWYIQTTDPDEIAVDVDNILYALSAYAIDERDYDDIDEARLRESEDPDEIKDITGYAKTTNDPVKILEEFGYVYSDQYGHKRWNKYWDLPRPLQTKREWWTPTFTKVWGSPDTHGQYVYGLLDPAAPNSKRTGYIIVQPLNRITGKDDWDITTSIRRMLLQVDNLMRRIPDSISDPDVLFNLLAAEMEKIKEAVNKEANATWNEALEVPDPDDPAAYVQRTRQAKLGELVVEICPGCGHKKEVFKNWPDNMPGLGSPCEKCGTFIPLAQRVVEADEPQPEPEIDAEKYTRDTLQPQIVMRELGYVAYTSAFLHWRKFVADRTQFMVWFHENFEWSLEVYEASGIHWKLIAISTMQKLGLLKSKLVKWEKKFNEGTLIDQKSGIVNEGEDDVDPLAYAIDTMLPDKVLTDLGYHSSTEGYWAKPVDPQTTFVVWPGYEAADYTFIVYRDVDGAWQSQGKYAFSAPVGVLKQRLEQWEKNLSTVDFKRSGALRNLVGEGVDDPGEVLAAHRPFVYSLWGQYASYGGGPVNFRVFPTLTEAIKEARNKRLRDEYDYVWIEEYEADDLSGWETRETFAVTDTGVRYEITSDYNVIKHVEEQPRGYARPPNQPRRVRENEEDEMDPKRYAETTFDLVEFLKASGWFKLKGEAYEYWAKDFPLPHEFILGTIVFVKLRVVVGFDLKLRGAYSCSIIIYWVQEDGNGFPGKNWRLDPQLITPADELATTEDYNRPLRRFVVEIGTVLSRIQWPPNEKATLLANTHLEADVSKFINALNYKAKQPLNDPPSRSATSGRPMRMKAGSV